MSCAPKGQAELILFVADCKCSSDATVTTTRTQVIRVWCPEFGGKVRKCPGRFEASKRPGHWPRKLARREFMSQDRTADARVHWLGRRLISARDEIVQRPRLQLDLVRRAGGSADRAAGEIQRNHFQLRRVGAVKRDSAAQFLYLPRIMTDIGDPLRSGGCRFGFETARAFLGHHLQQDLTRLGQWLVVERDGDYVRKIEVAGDRE